MSGRMNWEAAARRDKVHSYGPSEPSYPKSVYKLSDEELFRQADALAYLARYVGPDAFLQSLKRLSHLTPKQTGAVLATRDAEAVRAMVSDYDGGNRFLNDLKNRSRLTERQAEAALRILREEGAAA